MNVCCIEWGNAHANDFYCENVGFMFNWELC